MRMGIHLRRFVARSPRAPQRSVFRPDLEKLEDRCVPSINTGTYHVTNLVSDQPGVALLQDPHLVNGWGIGLSPSVGAFWVSDNEMGVTTLYRGDVAGSAFVTVPLVVTIPSESSEAGLPTGQLFNGTSDFVVGSGPATFIFASQTGEISAWRGSLGTTARVVASVDGAVYTGLAIGKVGSANFLYAANFANNSIDVFDTNFHQVNTEEAFSFSDPTIPPSYSPFNIQNLDGRLYVAYAQQSHDDPGEETGHGAGFVDVFDTDGTLLQRIVRGNHLNAPWGLALAPSGFGPFSNTLLVGNFGNGHIVAFDANTGKYLGQLQDESGRPIVIDGLWGITFGNGATAGDKNALYFAAGPDDETHGLFGSVRFVSDSSAALGPAAIDALSANPSGGAPTLPAVTPPNQRPPDAGVIPSGPSGELPSPPAPTQARALDHASERALAVVLDQLFSQQEFPPRGGLGRGLGR